MEILKFAEENVWEHVSDVYIPKLSLKNYYYFLDLVKAERKF